MQKGTHVCGFLRLAGNVFRDRAVPVGPVHYTLPRGTGSKLLPPPICPHRDGKVFLCKLLDCGTKRLNGWHCGQLLYDVWTPIYHSKSECEKLLVSCTSENPPELWGERFDPNDATVWNRDALGLEWGEVFPEEVCCFPSNESHIQPDILIPTAWCLDIAGAGEVNRNKHGLLLWEHGTTESMWSVWRHVSAPRIGSHRMVCLVVSFQYVWGKWVRFPYGLLRDGSMIWFYPWNVFPMSLIVLIHPQFWSLIHTSKVWFPIIIFKL